MEEITKKEMETYLRVKEFMNRSDYDESDMIDRFKNKNPSEVKLRVRSKGIDSVEYESIKDTSKEIGVSKETLLYAYHNRRQLIMKRKDGLKVFYVEWF